MLRESKIIFGLLETCQPLESKEKLTVYYLRNELHSMLNERYVFDSLWRLRPQYKPEIKKAFVELVFLAFPAGLQEIDSNGIYECHLGTRIFPRWRRDPRTHKNGLEVESFEFRSNKRYTTYGRLFGHYFVV